MSNTDRSIAKLDTDLISLRALVAVVEAGSFSAAAQQINRTQSAVSLQIAKLEQRLGVQLLNRTSRSLSLTTAGETFISYARRILALAEEATLAVAAPTENQLLRVGFAEYLVSQNLHTLLARFRRAHPHCDLIVTLGSGNEVLRKLANNELDICIAGPEADGGTVLWQEQLFWCCSAQLPDALDTPIELVLMPAPCSYRQKAFEALTVAGLSWKISLETNSIQAVQSAVRAGLGITVLPKSSISSDMCILDTLPTLPETSANYYYKQTNPYAERLIELLLAQR